MTAKLQPDLKEVNNTDIKIAHVDTVKASVNRTEIN